LLLGVEVVGLVIGEIVYEIDVSIVNFRHIEESDSDIVTLGGQVKLGEAAPGSHSVSAALRVFEGDISGNGGVFVLESDRHVLEALGSTVGVVIDSADFEGTIGGIGVNLDGAGVFVILKGLNGSLVAFLNALTGTSLATENVATSDATTALKILIEIELGKSSLRANEGEASKEKSESSCSSHIEILEMILLLIINSRYR
jgi:hypothetical protein